MKRVVSIGPGSSRRNKKVEAEFLGERFVIERIGTDGDLDRAAELIAEWDGQVDAFGLGGIDLYLVAGGRKYVIRDALRLANAARKTPVVDGSGLKHTLERETVFWLARDGMLGDRWTQREGVWQREHPQQPPPKVLIVCAVDRFGMAEAFAELGCRMVYGDLIFSLGIPIRIRSLKVLRLLARVALPYLCRQPFQKLYPTGEKQQSTTPRHRRLYAWAHLIGGDFHFIRRFLPPPAREGIPPLAGKIILTNTTTAEDVEELRKRGLWRLVTTTPELEGRSFGTNVMEAVLVALSGKRPEALTPEDYLELLHQLRWQPRVSELNPPHTGEALPVPA
jgi:hypothetical protein